MCWPGLLLKEEMLNLKKFFTCLNTGYSYDDWLLSGNCINM